MVEITRKQVIPGDVIITGDYRPGMFVQRRGNEMVALRIGLAEIIRNDVKVIPLSGAYMPRVEDQVVGPGFLPEVAVHPRPETQSVRVADLVGRRQPGPDRTVGVERLAHGPRR